MLEKELAQATKLAEQANKKVEQLRKRLVSESEKAHARAKRELTAARKRHTTANARLKKARDAFEKDFITKKLEENNWNISKTADILEIERSNLHRKIKAYDIRTP